MVEHQLTKPNSQQTMLSGSRESMEPLYEQLLSQTFGDNQSAVEFCRQACAEFGFTIKQEASANKNIYVYCSREGLPDSLRKPKPAPQRKRPSKRCDCRWRIVLSETSQGRWEFRKSTSAAAYEHNHEMMDPNEMVKAWPAQVNDYIIQLARQQRQHLQTHDIRELVKQRFPEITWNERRFYNRLTEERKRIRQREIISRVQRLLLLSAQICSVVAAAPSNEWFGNVEANLTGLFDHYAQLTRLPTDMISSLVDLQLDHISIDTPDSRSAVARKPASCSTDTPIHPHHLSSSVKMEKWDNPLENSAPRKRIFSHVDSPSIPLKGTHMIHVPPFKLYVRPHHIRPLLSQHQQQQQQQTYPLHHRLSFSDSMSSPSSSSPHSQQLHTCYSLESSSSSSISSTASVFQQQHTSSMPSSSDQLQYQPSISTSNTSNTSISTSNTSNTSNMVGSSTPSFYLPGSNYQSPQPFSDYISNNNSRHNSTSGISMHPTDSLSFHPHFGSSHSNDMTFLDHPSLLAPPTSSISPPPSSSSPPPSSGSSSCTHTSTPTHQLPVRMTQQGYRSVTDTAATNHSHDTAILTSTSNQPHLFVYSATGDSCTTIHTPTPSTTTKEGFVDAQPQPPPFSMDGFSVPPKTPPPTM